MTKKISRFLAQRRPATPCLVLDLDIVNQNYAKLRQAMPDAVIYYAMKANPAPEILSLLTALGSSFDAASVNEIDMVLATGAGPERISFGNTIKKQADIAAAFDRGVRLYAFDSWAELAKLAAAAPGSRVFCRISTSGDGAEWPLSRKFGCEPRTAAELLRLAAALGLEPYGVSFHVGSQQRDPAQWDQAVAEAAKLFRELADDGVTLGMLNIGGGLPTRYRNRLPSLCAYGAVIRRSIRRHFGNRRPDVIVEPGRQMVGDAGIIQTEVVLIAERERTEPSRWVYLDIGKFGGLAETIDEAIKYPILSSRRGPSDRVVLAGPTCDSADVLYEQSDYRLPLDLKIGDKLEIRSAGAYTTTYASVAFNGFEPLRCYCI
ncbi:MAG: type III PLP-dependent enzyme [Rhodospirillales bacterium]|jgi:ornithine decarboxylase|nr:type III PLP-dependent enzyme [Rhodospirillales bacterium]